MNFQISGSFQKWLKWAGKSEFLTNYDFRECAILGDYDGSIEKYKQAIGMTEK